MIDAIFIVGTGRSGTHFLCKSLLDFYNIDDYMNGEENHIIRHPLTIDAILHKDLNRNAINYYKKQVKRAKDEGKVFLDQCHTNLYHVDILAQVFPNALFLNTVRPAEQIVASMLKHNGVQSWIKYARTKEIPYPNQFLGLHNKRDLDLPNHILCAKRVAAHQKKATDLKKKYNAKFRFIYFEKMIENKWHHMATTLDEYCDYVGPYKETVITDSSALIKYKELGSKKIKQIQKVV